MAETNAVDTLLVRSDGEVERLAACGPPLGALPAGEYRSPSTTMGRGDLLIVYTDGITEAVDPDDRTLLFLRRVGE